MMEKDDYLKYNQFITLATELYDLKIMHHVKDPALISYTTEKKGLFKKVKKAHYNPEDSLYINIQDFISDTLHENSDTPLSFRTIWEFCDFVRWAEKALFYDNSLSNRVIVDSVMGAGIINDDPKIIVFQSVLSSTVTIRLELTKKKIIQQSVLDLDNAKDNTSHIITIEVVRHFGKSMKSKYVVVDENVNYKDLSDIYLMNTINKIVKECIINVFREIIFQIESGYIFTDFSKDTDEQLKNIIASHFS